MLFTFINLFSCSGSGSSRGRSLKTFIPKKKIPEGTYQYNLTNHASATLGSGNLRIAVRLPLGEDINEWVAFNSKCQSVNSHILKFM